MTNEERNKERQALRVAETKKRIKQFNEILGKDIKVYLKIGKTGFLELSVKINGSREHVATISNNEHIQLRVATALDVIRNLITFIK